jgi:hypothetical protein
LNQSREESLYAHTALRGKTEGNIEGKVESKIEVGKKMIEKGMNNTDIHDITSLSLEVVEGLR